MIKFVLSCSFCALTSFLFSQSYSYSFDGELSSEKQIELSNAVLKVNDISSCDLKYKPDSKKGEIIFYVKESEIRSESSNEFSPVQIKGILIEYQLSPLDFRKIK